jgi:hypothetical protein
MSLAYLHATTGGTMEREKDSKINGPARIDENQRREEPVGGRRETRREERQLRCDGEALQLFEG